MNRHRLYVVPFAGNPPSEKITFRCARCVLYLEIERHTMEAILLKGDRRLETVPFRVLGECLGA